MPKPKKKGAKRRRPVVARLVPQHKMRAMVYTGARATAAEGEEMLDRLAIMIATEVKEALASAEANP